MKYFFIIVILSCIVSNYADITVGHGQQFDYQTIQEAIEVAGQNGNSNSINVASGIYQESINFLGKNLKIHGSNTGTTIIDAENSLIAVDMQDAEFAEFRDFTVTGNTITTNSIGINGNKIHDNDSGIYINEVHHAYLAHNFIYNNGTGIDISDNYYITHTLYKNTITQNDTGIHFGEYSTNSIENSIIWDNQIPFSGIQNNVDINYSCIEGGHEGVGNINTNPLLDSYLSLKWDFTGRSPCIDSGNPEILDLDGTPSDMGAIPAVTHRFDKWKFVPSTFNWISFPVLDKTYTDDNFIINKFADYLQYNKLQEIGWSDFLTGDLKQFLEVFLSWSNADHIMSSPQGYIIITNEIIDIDCPGQLEDPATIIHLHSGPANWIGYFLEESQTPDVAFAEIWDNVTMVQTKNWTAQKVDGNWLGLGYTINYADMVIVYVTETCDFAWNNSYTPIPAIDRDLAENFSYEEEMLYIPVYVDLGVDYQDVSEIGIFVDGECQGAAKVENQITEINTYILDDNLTGNEIVEFELSYDNRTSNKKVVTYSVHDENQKCFIVKDLSLKPSDIIAENTYFVALNVDKGINVPAYNNSLEQNYPNPFNPSTRIKFCLSANQQANLSIFNVRGQLIKTLANGPLSKGYQEVIWNGDDNQNNKVTSGVYFYRLDTKDCQINKTMLLLK